MHQPEVSLILKSRSSGGMLTSNNFLRQISYLMRALKLGISFDLLFLLNSNLNC